IHNSTERLPGPWRLGEVVHAHLALPRFQRIGADVGQIELFVGKRHRRHDDTGQARGSRLWAQGSRIASLSYPTHLPLENKHRIPVAIEPIALRDGLTVRSKNTLPAGKR